MKITINVECSPEEARAFLGLPDVTPVNQTIMNGLQKRTEENLEAFTDPQKFYEQMIAAGAGNVDVMQKMFASFTGQSGTKPRS